MTRAAFLGPLVAMVCAACGGGAPAQPAPAEPVVRVDTITITREVEPPLPEGRAATVCLASGENVQVRISPAGDTLIGPRRIRLADLGPAVGFVGDYAADAAWFVSDQPLTFEQRSFSRFGQPESRDCGDMKIVGDFNGVNLFSDFSAAAPFDVVYVPVRPGVFQPYQTQVGRVRG